MNNISTTTNKELMAQARVCLQERWTLAIGTYLLLTLIFVSLAGCTGGILSILASGPLSVGAVLFSLSLSRKQKASTSQLFMGFKRLEATIIYNILIMIYTILWSLLFLVPGIVAAFSYLLTPFIIAEDKTISASEAIKKSKELMKGNKCKAFCLVFRFFGWFLLCLLTLGIGFLWLIPYMHVSVSNFYLDVVKQDTQITQGTKTKDELEKSL